MSENPTEHGCFTTTRVDAMASSPSGVGARGWSHHVARLRRDTAALFGERITDTITAEEMGRAVVAELTGHTLPRIVRLAVSSNTGAIDASSRDLTPDSTPLRLVTAIHHRWRPELKHTYTAPEFAVKNDALSAGYDDALMIDQDGVLREGTFWTLLLGRPDGTWVTPAGAVLPSTTLAVIEAALSQAALSPTGSTIARERLTVTDLDQFDRAVALNAGQGPRAIGSITHIGATSDEASARRWHSSGDVGQIVAAYSRSALESIVIA